MKIPHVQVEANVEVEVAVKAAVKVTVKATVKATIFFSANTPKSVRSGKKKSDPPGLGLLGSGPLEFKL